MRILHMSGPAPVVEIQTDDKGKAAAVKEAIIRLLQSDCILMIHIRVGDPLACDPAQVVLTDLQLGDHPKCRIERIPETDFHEPRHSSFRVTHAQREVLA